MKARPRLRALLSLSLIGLFAAMLLSGVDRLTREPIAAAEQRRALAALTELVPAARFDNDPVKDRIERPLPGFGRSAIIHQARLGDQPVALIFDVTTPRGYAGDIRLLVALDPEGVLLGVRVLTHRETPGLGDRIEARRSDWIDQFSGRSLDNPMSQRWVSDRRGGAFDTITAATVTTDAVIDAVRRVLVEAQAAGQSLWEPVPAPGES